MQKISNEKGITMVTLVITIFILALISIPTAFSVVNIIKVGDLTKYKEDLTNLSEAVSQAYSLEDNISGIGLKRKEQLLKKYHSINKLKSLSIDELDEILPHNVSINLHNFLNNYH